MLGLLLAALLLPTCLLLLCVHVVRGSAARHPTSRAMDVCAAASAVPLLLYGFCCCPHHAWWVIGGGLSCWSPALSAFKVFWMAGASLLEAHPKCSGGCLDSPPLADGKVLELRPLTLTLRCPQRPGKAFASSFQRMVWVQCVFIPEDGEGANI